MLLLLHDVPGNHQLLHHIGAIHGVRYTKPADCTGTLAMHGPVDHIH